MGLFVAWIAFSIVAGVIASNKGRSSVGFFFLALVLSPILGIIAALIAKPDEKKIDKSKIAAGDSKKCPFCAEVIKAEAMVCRYCGRELTKAKEVDWIVKKYSQEEKKESTEPKDNKGTNFGIFFAILCLLAIGIIIMDNYNNDDETNISKDSRSEVKPSKPSLVSSERIDKGFVEVGYYKKSNVFNSYNRVFSIYVEDFKDSPDVWDRIEKYGKSKMWSPKGSTTVFFFNNKENTPDVTFSGINFPDRYESYWIAGYWKYTTGKEIFNKYPAGEIKEFSDPLEKKLPEPIILSSGSLEFKVRSKEAHKWKRSKVTVRISNEYDSTVLTARIKCTAKDSQGNVLASKTSNIDFKSILGEKGLKPKAVEFHDFILKVPDPSEIEKVDFEVMSLHKKSIS